MATYDAAHKSLRLREALDDFEDREDVEVVIRKSRIDRNAWRTLENSLPKEQAEDLAAAIEKQADPKRKASCDPHRPWLAFSGIMTKEQGEDFARVIEEMFPPWNDDRD